MSPEKTKEELILEIKELQQKYDSLKSKLDETLTTHAESKSELKENLLRLNRAEKIGKIGDWEYDLNNNTAVWSEQVFELYERDPKLGPPNDDEIAKYYTEEDHKRLRAYIQQIIATGDPVEDFICAVTPPSGKTILCNGSMFPIIDNSGKIIKIFGVLQDVTHQKKTEQELNTVEAKYKILFEQAPEGILIINDKGNCIDVNQRGCELLKYTKEELLKLQITDVVEKEDLKNVPLKYDQVKKDNTLLSERLLIRKDGSTFPGEISVKKLSDDTIQGIFRDLTQRKKIENDLVIAKEKAEKSDQLKSEILLKQKDAELSLKKSEFYLRKAQETGKMGHFNLDPVTNIVEGSKVLFDLFDVTPDEPLFEAFAGAVHPEDGDIIFPAIDKTLKEGIPYDVEHRILHKDGTLLLVHSKGDIVESELGRRMFGTVQDITELKKIEDELNVVETKYKTLFEQASEGIFIFNYEGTFLDVNQRGCDMLQCSKEELLKLPLTDFLEKENLIAVPIKYDQIRIDKVLIYERVFIRKDGSTFLGEVSLKGISDVSVQGFVRDLTERKRFENDIILAKEKAEESEAQLLKIVELKEIAEQASKSGSWRWVIKNNNVEWSDNMCRIHGMEPHEFNKTFEVAYSFHHPDDRESSDRDLAMMLEKKQDMNFYYRIITKKGDLKYVFATCKLFFNNDRDVSEIAGTVQDISDLKENEIKLSDAKKKAEEADQLKSAFLANMSHEIRSPMNAILGFSSILKRENLSIDKREKYLDLINSGGKRLLNIISDIVDISKLDANQLAINSEAFNLNELIDDIQSQFNIHEANKVGKIITTKALVDAESIVSSDESRLAQILSNLLENSIKFTKEGVIEFGYTYNDEMIQFFVKDTGMGIAPQYHNTIFERFKQVENVVTKSGSGTGLGLPIVKSLVELLGGKIWVESEKGKGATFFFTIPYQITIQKNDKVEIPDTANIDASSEKIVLIAEDEIINYIYMEALFEDYPCKVIHANNGKEAVEMAKNNNSICIVLMDIKMPEMNGFEATEIIRQSNKDLPIIALTAYAMADDKKKILDAGFNDYLSKPFEEVELIEIVEKYCKGANKT